MLRNLKLKHRRFLDQFEHSGENLFQPIPNEEEFEGLPLCIMVLQTRDDLTRIMEEERKIDSADIECISAELARIISESRMQLEKGVFSLSTATSIAPFLGLLGTVWGVMESFVGMGQLGNASMAAVAPGLSEALVTTAIGLIVAIPASITYNYTLSRIQEEITIMNNFALELLSNIEKQFVTKTSQ